MASTTRKIHAYTGPAIFSRGFRPFFLTGALFAGLVMPLWSVVLSLGLARPGPLDGAPWHAHEMIFGYVAAVIAGFLLTAVPNWTGRLPVLGLPLAALWGLWMAGRIVMNFPVLPPLGAAITDAAFLVVFAAILLREIIGGNNRKNLPIVLIISLLAATNILFHYYHLTDQPTEPAERAALGLTAILISLIGGRIIPSFTRNWMVRQNISPLPTTMNRFDMAVMAFGTISILAWVLLPARMLTGMLFATAAIAYLFRLARWRGWATFSEPMVAILHLGYLWLVVWFALTALSILTPDIIDPFAALHALTAGAIGTMTIAVATRASLGHSGREITATPAINAIFALLFSGALLRILAGWLPLDYLTTVSVAGLLWAAGMLVFVFALGPVLLKKR